MYDNYRLDNILDKIFKSGKDSLNTQEKTYLDKFSNNEHEDMEKELTNREFEYHQILNSDMRFDDNFTQMMGDMGSSEEDANFIKDMPYDDVYWINLETLWDLIEEEDLNSFIEEYNYPIDLLSFNWGDLSDGVKYDFKEYSNRWK